MISKFISQARMCAAQAFDGGVFYVASGYVLRLLRPLMLMLIWRELLAGRDEAFTLNQLLCYTLWSSLLSEQLNVHTSASEDLWNGAFGKLYLRPVPVLWQVTAETFGRWIPGWLFFTLPTLLLAVTLGLPAAPTDAIHGVAGGVSLALSVSLGFCVDYLFMTLQIRMKNLGYQAVLIRRAVTIVLSGALIPFAVLPWGLGDILALLPMGALAGAPLSVYTGLSDIGKTVLLQVFWNLALWPLALAALRRVRERMVSYGE